MADVAKSLNTLKVMLFNSIRSESISEKAAFYASARWILADIEGQLSKHGLATRGSEALLRIEESFGSVLGTVSVGAPETYGMMGISTIKELMSEFDD